MNPDGTGQRAVYGSNSWWPNSIFYARPIPGRAGWFVAIVSGHHGVARMGELILFDVQRGERDAEGAVQRIPGRGRKVEPVIVDQLVQNSWPKFLHPYPLGDETVSSVAGKFFLVSAKPSPTHRWGLYMVDVYDNMVLIRDEPGWAWLEPMPLKPRLRPPVIPSQVDPSRRDATVLLADIYAGEAMRGVPRGTVRSLRLFAYNYALPGTGGHIDIGIDGPWDARRILGTVPVEDDGSAHFIVPANTPIALQPLDADGRAVQIMRSWFSAMPGERLSCVGCHERNAEVGSTTVRKAFLRPPSPVEPWRGPPRPFSFRREVQPVLDRHCVRCHDGTDPSRPDFRVHGAEKFGHFTPSYVALHPYVNRPGPESDYRVRPPGEYYAETSELIFRLLKGHHDVQLSEEDWDRLVTWIDLNVPDLGTWTERIGRRPQWADLRTELRARYANMTDDWELYPNELPRSSEEGVVRAKRERLAKSGGQFSSAVETAPSLHIRAAQPLLPTVRLEVAKGVALEMVQIPAGRFQMGDSTGFADEQPVVEVEVPRAFWISRTEVPNKLYALFDPTHDSEAISPFNKDHAHPGFPANGPDQPVIRVSWYSARAFCQWLSDRFRVHFDLPSEAQWEYACRAGTRTPMFYGEVLHDFRPWANLADAQLARLCIRDSPPWIPRISVVNDGATGPAPVGRYAPNPWGLFDMHGNVAEWTRSVYRPYPELDDGQSDDPHLRRVVRGGSWRDRPVLARSACRWPLPPWGRYATVGFRVVCEGELPDRVVSAAP
jgi:formylglycine-generating enzyme required for sulfatase activity